MFENKVIWRVLETEDEKGKFVLIQPVMAY